MSRTVRNPRADPACRGRGRLQGSADRTAERDGLLTIDPNMSVDEIMRRWPATIRVFIRHRMLCIGCPIGIFHTVNDACEAHGLQTEVVARELLAAMHSDSEARGPSAFESAE